MKAQKNCIKADILISELLKGKVLKSIYVAGRSDGNMGSSYVLYS
jgi:hypothetical protein